MNKIEFMQFPAKVYCGSGCVKNVKQVLDDNNASRIALFVDRSVLQGKPFQTIKEACYAHGEVMLIDSITSEPTARLAGELSQKVKEFRADFVFAVGGGSVMDVAKITALILGSELTVTDIMEGKTVCRKTPFAVAPTTAGTGAEATPNAIVLDEAKELKVGIVNQTAIADVVFLDSDFILSVPKGVVASTGLDALTHSVECFTSNKANEISDLFALQAFKLIYASLGNVYRGDCAVEEYENIQRASYYAGIAIRHSGTTAVHALSYPLGGKYHIAHGVSNAILFAPVMEYNFELCKDKFAVLYDAVTTKPCEDKALFILNWIKEIVAKLNIPQSLNVYGVTKQDIPALAQSALEVQRLLVNNIRRVDLADAELIYKKVIY